MTSESPHSRTRRRLAGVVIAVVTLMVSTAVTAYAAPPPHLPQRANGYEQSFSPAYDYDYDGCYAVPAIGADGRLNPGLELTGAVNGNCHDRSDLDNSQTYSRSKCNNGWCAIVYASYFEKDQAIAGSGLRGHRHDWEHVISWVNQSSNRVEYVTTAKHSGQVTYPRSQVRFENTHPKIVYHKDGGTTHYFRLADNDDEPPENHYHNWRYPPLVGWDGWPSQGLRYALMYPADFGQATIKITDKDDRFRYFLSASKPGGIPFNPWA